jgi:hypothetical protein
VIRLSGSACAHGSRSPAAAGAPRSGWRPSFPLRRPPGSMPAAPNVHCGEREITARN